MNTPITLSVVFIASISSFGCETDRTYVCTVGQDSECIREGLQGACLAPGHCAFSDSSCEEGLRWDPTASDKLAGQCVSGTDSTTNACGGTTELTALPGTPCGICNSGSYACDGLDALICGGEANLEKNITTQGQVSASSYYQDDDRYMPSRAIDGRLSTSWFSKGVTDGTESTYTWTSIEDRCFQSIHFVGNGLHEVTNFRKNFGFNQLAVEILDASGKLVDAKTKLLDGSPDPTVTITPGGIRGRTVLLRLQGHESPSCGGFSELTVNALE